ncbi:MAG: alginate lyase family protein [Acidobacteriaceae bacterium]
MDRRTFCITVASTAACTQLPLMAQKLVPTTYDLIATVDRQRILAAAKLYVDTPIQTITSFVSPKSPGGPHDFFSQADYFWPNPKNPDGPYINRDGQSNPANFNDHRKAMIRLSVEMPALTAAWLLLRHQRGQATLGKKYGDHAAEFLRAWFVHAETRMNPNLEFAQGVHGVSTGRNYGIIDTLHLVEVARAASLLSPNVLSSADQNAVKQWFREYLHWMKISAKGIKERDTLNNHAVCWALQAAEFARLIVDEETRNEVRHQYEARFLPEQMGLNGSFPKELVRTKPYSYSIFNFDVMATLCESLEIDGPDSKRDIFAFQLSDGRGICKAAAFLYPFLKNKTTWPYVHDVEHYDALPVRSPGLLFCGVHCNTAKYVELWKTMNPDPTDPEIIRNYPIRQPLLWFA